MTNTKITIDLFNQAKYEIKEIIVKKNILRILNKNQIAGNFEVGIHFVDSKEIKKLNNKFRQIDKITDVLSFPTNEKIINQPNNNIANWPINNIGDIFVCPLYAKKQVEERYNDWYDLNLDKQQNIIDKEIIFLINHGIKHLIGIHHKE